MGLSLLSCMEEKNTTTTTYLDHYEISLHLPPCTFVRSNVLNIAKIKMGQQDKTGIKTFDIDFKKIVFVLG